MRLRKCYSGRCVGFRLLPRSPLRWFSLDSPRFLLVSSRNSIRRASSPWSSFLFAARHCLGPEMAAVPLPFFWHSPRRGWEPSEGPYFLLFCVWPRPCLASDCLLAVLRGFRVETDPLPKRKTPPIYATAHCPEPLYLDTRRR